MNWTRVRTRFGGIKEQTIRICVTEAKAQLTDLVKQAEAGEDVVLTRHGQPVARLTAIKPTRTREERRAILEELSRSGAAKALPGPCAARRQVFLDNEDGLPA